MIKVRKANLEDKEKLNQLVKTMLGDRNADATAKLVVEDFFANTQYNVFVAEAANEVVGFGVLKFESFEGANAVAEIVWLKVDDAHKRAGYGRCLLSFMEQYAKENDIRKIYLKTGIDNKSAVCFYIVQDYQFEARMLDFGCKGHDDYYLSKNL